MSWFNFLRVSLIGAGILFLSIMFPFWKPIVWGITIAIISSPLNNLLLKYIKSKHLSSFLTTLLVIVVVAIPITLAVLIMINEIEKFIDNIDAIKQAFESVVLKVQSIYHLKVFAPWINKIDNFLFSALQQIGVFTTNHLGAVFSQVYTLVAEFIFSFITAFYFIKDGNRFLSYMSELSGDKNNFDKVILSIKQVVKATILGGVLTALIQGCVGALGFLAVGLNTFFMWMFLIALFSFVPMIGTAIVWVPVAIYFFIIGKYLSGLFIIIWGVVAIGLIDNYVRPLIISSQISMHPMFLFFGILGAVFVFGPIGILLGPIILSIADVLARSYIESKKSKT